MDNGYEQVPVGHGRVRFTVIPARVPPARLVPLLAGAATLGLALLLVPAGTPVRLCVGALLGAWVGGRVRRAWAARLERSRFAGGTFTASPAGVELPGGAAENALLPQLSVRNLLTAGEGPGRSRSAAVPCAYALCVGSNPLAGGMSEAVALSLLEEVGRVVGGEIGARGSGATPGPPELSAASLCAARR